jgi:hypothetical protein
MTYRKTTTVAVLVLAMTLLAVSCVTVPVESMREVAPDSDLSPYGEPGDDLVEEYYQVLNEEIVRLNSTYHSKYESQYRTDRIFAASFSVLGLVGETVAVTMPAFGDDLEDASRIVALATGSAVTLYFGINTILQGSNIGYGYQLERFSARQLALLSISDRVRIEILTDLRSDDPDVYLQAIDELTDVIRVIREDSYYEPE